MAHDVFISYSSNDKPTADAACAMLERYGIRCWIAPRDIVPGMVWSEAIINALDAARVMILVFSGHANASPQVEREIARAVSKGLHIIPMRIEDVQFSKSLQYFLGTPHWLDAFTPPLEKHLEGLAGAVKNIVEMQGGVRPQEALPAAAVGDQFTPLEAQRQNAVAYSTTESRLGKYVVLHTAGRVDHYTGDRFREALLSLVVDGDADVIIDFRDVTYISSIGLNALMVASRRKSSDRKIAIAALNAVVEEVFTISRFDRVIAVFASTDAAAEAWDAASRPQPVAPPISPIRIHFWGTRGSLPVSLGSEIKRASIREALLIARERGLPTIGAIDDFIDRELPFPVRGTYGGNTSCVEIVTGGEEYVLCDLGSGAREFGNRVLAQYGPARKACYNFFMSHVHWDHIMGFPFFAPAYIPGNTIRIYGCHKTLREAMLRQQSDPCFPVHFEALGASIEFVELEPGTEYQIGGLSVRAIKQFHSGDSFGYRFSRGGKAIVYSTDCEHKYEVLDGSYPFVEFYRDADLLIFDAMHSLAEAISVKEDWGHSSNIVAAELAQMARVKRLVMFHHEPAFDDSMIEKALKETMRFEELTREDHKVDIISAYDGLEITI